MRSIVLNLCSQNGLGAKKWEKLAPQFKADSIFKIEKGPDWQDLPDWLKAQVKTEGHPVIAVGGDGTVHSVLQILQKLKLKATLGMIGLGSSNDYHKPHDREGIEWMGKAPARIRFEQAKAFDLLHFTLEHEGNKTEQWSALNASVGITANGNAIFNDSSSFPSRLKGASVDAAIGAAALQAYFKSKPLLLKITADDRPPIEKQFVKLGIFKRAFFAGSFHYDQAPAVDDGRFGFASTEACSKWQQLRILMSLAKGEFSKLPHCSLQFHSKLRIESKIPFILEIDGETQNVDTVQVEVLPKSMLLCP